MSEAESIAKYEAWIVELKARQTKVISDRQRMKWLIVPAVVAVPASAYWGAAVFAMSLAFWSLLIGASIYLATMHRFEYTEQLAHAEHELELLRKAQAQRAAAGAAAGAGAGVAAGSPVSPSRAARNV